MEYELLGCGVLYGVSQAEAEALAKSIAGHRDALAAKQVGFCAVCPARSLFPCNFAVVTMHGVFTEVSLITRRARVS